MSNPPTESDQSPLAVTLLGGFRIRCGDAQRTSGLLTRKMDSVFAYLLLNPGRTFKRAELSALFWPHDAPEDARHSLRTAAGEIRKVVEPNREDEACHLIGTSSTLRLEPAPEWWVDVWVVDQLLETAKGLTRGSVEWFCALEEAATHYGGRLLTDFEDEWIYAEQQRLQERMLEAIRQLARGYLETMHYDRAGRWELRGLEIDHCDEECHRVLISLYLRRGQLAYALRQYDACVAALSDLESEPEPETRAFLAEIEARAPRLPDQTDRFSALREKAARVPASPPALVPTTAVLGGPFVARERERSLLHAAWQRAEEGSGAFLLISGEPGIGKTRLGRALVNRANRADALGLYSPTSPGEMHTPFQPLIDPVRRVQRLASTRGLHASPPLWMAERALPSVDGICQFFLSLARQRPLCLFLDDLQWADAETGQLLHALATRAPEEPLLLIASVTEGDADEAPWIRRWIREVEGQRLATRIALPRLTAEESLALLSGVSAGNASDSLIQTLSRRLDREAEGNPQILLETLGQWFNAGILGMTREGRWSVSQDAATRSRLTDPPTLQSRARRRVACLRDEDRELLNAPR